MENLYRYFPDFDFGSNDDEDDDDDDDDDELLEIMKICG